MHVLPATISVDEYLLVYNALSFVVASMGASTFFFFFHSAWVAPKFKTALTITGLVTLIAFYHYLRIFNSWVAAYDVGFCDAKQDSYCVTANGAIFNDAYRYMDWLLTVPLLLVELILVMNLSEKETVEKAWKLGSAAALMIILGYPGEISTENSTRWTFWVLAMIPFCYIVYVLFVGLAAAVEKQPEAVRSMISNARYVTIFSWCTYPIVFILPMLGLSPAGSVVGIQVGYSISDVIAKCGVGIMITKIAIKSSKNMKGSAFGENESLIQ